MGLVFVEDTMRICWLALAVLLAPGSAHAASWLQCDQSELKDPSCATLSTNYTPLHVTAGCVECSGGGSDINCSAGQKVTAQTLGLDTASDNKPVAGAFSQAGTCDFGVPLWKFSGGLTKGVTYNVVVSVAGHEKLKLLTFTAGSSNPGVDGSVPPPPTDGGGSSSTDGGGTVPGQDGGSSSTGDGSTGGNGGSGEEGCSCRVAPDPGPTPWILLGFLLLVVLPRRRS